MGDTGAIVACGRELWSTSLLQQRLVNAQQSMERQYAKLRHAETRYRLLFQMTNEAVLILDGNTAKIVEVNPAAEEILNREADLLRDTVFLEALDESCRGDVMAFFNTLRAAGRGDDVRAKLVHGGTAVTLSGSLFRQDNATLILLRLKPQASVSIAPSALAAPSNLLEVIEKSPDALVVTDRNSRIITCNPAFLELAQLPNITHAVDQSLERWLGRPGVDLNVLIVNLRQHGAVRLYPTTMRTDFGSVANVELSGVAVEHGRETHFGYMIRNVDQRPRGEGPTVGQGVPRSVHQLTELVGRVPLKELVRETVDEIEHLCIEAALELTGDNRASAAELLGLSRQSLYVKLRRYGIAEASSGADGSS
ncbi:MAG: transcriptional regulator PpsR [Pseudomonadota bacterium]